MNLSGDIVLVGIPSLQLVPPFNFRIAVENIGRDVHMSQEGFLICAVIDVNVDVGVLPKNITEW